MTGFIRHALLLAAAGLVGAAIVVGLGLYDVSARKGHWPGMTWLLHTAFDNAVELRAPASSVVPELNSPDLIALGARHYDGACRVCHGAPDGSRSATIRAMLPEPPPIIQAVGDWQPEEQFWIVKNGVKMTGMPAWPTERRDDDIWAIVAFLEHAGAVANEYAELVAPPPVEPTDAVDDADLEKCSVCHGVAGRGRDNELVPRLDILGQPYLEASLLAYRSGARQSGIMHHAASTLDDAAIAALAQHFALAAATDPEGRPTLPVADAPLIEAGRRLALGPAGDPDIATCSACHGPWPTRRSPFFPAIAGQTEAYLRTQLQLWRAGERGGSGRAELMHQVAADLTDGDIDALAAFYASLPVNLNEWENENTIER